jgi:hypothetical protein
MNSGQSDQWLWNCPMESFLVPLAQGWRLSEARGEPSFQDTGHGRFAVLLWISDDQYRGLKRS